MTYTTISATKARNNFFQIIEEAYKEKKAFKVEKNKIPLVTIIPETAILEESATTSNKNEVDQELQAKLDKVRELSGGLSLEINLTAEEIDDLYDLSYDE